MKSLGIIAEYNPFHKGHALHQAKSLEMPEADVTVAVISGNMTQRGQFPLLDKWARAEMAVDNGIDLVVEMPVIFSCNSAGYFAASGVAILESLGVNWISFGSESGDLNQLMLLANLIKENQEGLEEKIRLLVKEGLAYPRARQEGLNAIIAERNIILDKELLDQLESPNNILALEYLKSIKKAEPITFKRQGAGYNDEFDTDGLASASYIRRCMKEGSPVEAWLTEATIESIKDNIGKGEISGEKDRFPMLAQRILTMTEEELERLAAGGEGLGNKIKQSIRKCKSEEELIAAIKSKRYTHTRLSRLMGQILLNITDDDVALAKNYIRVLAFNEKGSKYIKKIKKADSCRLPIITNINKELEGLPDILPTIKKDILAGDLYNLAAGRNMYLQSDFVEKPLLSLAKLLKSGN